MRYLLIFLFLVPSILMYAQNYEYSEVDSISWELYRDGKYAELIRYGKKALRKDVDFYYLRMRVGIAAYQRKNYDFALAQFRSAYTMNPGDSSSWSYLYWSMNFTGRYSEAEEFYFKHPAVGSEAPAKKVDDLATSFELVSLTAGATLTNNTEQQSADIRSEENQLSIGTLQGNTYFSTIYLQNKFSPRFRISNAFSLFQVESLGLLDSKMFEDAEHGYSNLNYQYNFNAGYEFKKDWTLSIGLGYFKEETNFITAELGEFGSGLLVEDSFTQHDSWLGMLLLKKRIRNYGVSFYGGAGSFSDKEFYQGGIDLFWLPFGNTSLNVCGSGIWIHYDGIDRYSVGLSLSGLIRNRWSWGVQAFVGEPANIATQMGLRTYNTNDPLKLLTLAGIEYSFGKHLSLSLNYSYQEREGAFERVQSLQENAIQKFIYQNHSVSCTINWRF